ncbi:VENN motif pre-toxin domain-containing protein [Moraxella oculi]|uniref:VENN motif pre-toxin domain-containing protein n=1 Tax=Moraxella oculi TaxID=2940516 RepID=A0ABW8U7H9_9GAMM
MNKKLRLFDGITSALYAPNSNGIIGDVARAASPELAYRIGQEFKENKILNQTDNGSRPEEQSLQHLLAHAILGAATSYATGNDITTGALSGAGSEVAAPALANYLYGTKDPSELSQEQKDTITSILSLTIAAAAYTATDGSTTDAVSGAEIGKVAFEWNGGTNSIQKGKALKAKACKAGDVDACNVETLKSIISRQIHNGASYALKSIQNQDDITILNFGYGVSGCSLVMNNHNGNIYRTDMFEVELSPTVTGFSTSLTWGNYTHRPTSPEDLDSKISGASLTILGCYRGVCTGNSISSNNHASLRGVGTNQLSYSGGALKFSGYHLDKQTSKIVEGPAPGSNPK